MHSNDSAPTWFDRRHAERYAKIMRGEMTLQEALAENDADWRVLHPVDALPGSQVSGKP